MLIAKDGVISNALFKGSTRYEQLAQDKRADVAIRLPIDGVPLTSGTKFCEKLFVSNPVDVAGKAMKRTNILDFKARLYKEGVIVETIGNRKGYLEFLVANASNKANRIRVERELARFNQATSGLSLDSVIWCTAVDRNGNLFVSSAGVLNQSDLDLSTVTFSNGSNLKEILNNYVANHEGTKSSIGALNMVPLPALNLNTKVNEAEVKQAIALTGCLLTIRGFHAQGRSAEDVMAEWNMVAQPLLEALPDTVFNSWDMPWAISTFPGLTLSDADRARANVVAPYLAAAAGLFVTSASSLVGDQLRMITLFKEAEWNFTNSTYTARIKGNTLVFDPTINTVIANALAMDKGALDQVALQVLEAAQVYGKSMGDGSTWARLLWCEWLGISGLLGGLSINASS